MKVVVIGGGAAGMMAALAAAQGSGSVTIFEKNSSIGALFVQLHLPFPVI